MTLNRRTLMVSMTAWFAAPFALTANAAAGAGRGSFRGASGHKTSGNVTVTKTGSGYRVRFEGNFSLDGAPDPWLGFGRNGRYLRRSQFSKLKSNRGAQSYSVPKSAGAQDFNEVYVWCRKFGVPLGVARIR